MVHAFLALLTCQLAGEILVRLSGLPLPGPVLGLILLLGLLMARRKDPPQALAQTADGLLSHLSLLFVPAGVGVIVHLDRIRADWLPLGAALVVSTLLAIIVTALVFQAVSRRFGGGDPA